MTRPVQLGDVTLLVDGETGEVAGWAGLNDDPDRCASQLCGGCPRRCRCAPCRCPECDSRADLAVRPTPEPLPKLMLL